MIQATLFARHLQVQCRGLEAAGIVLSGEFTCDLNAGHVHLLLGANGVGKSTLLRALANALPGQALLFKPEYGLRDELLVNDQLCLVLKHLGCVNFAPLALLAAVGLSDWQFERIGTLSSGQRARLGLCTLLAASFRVWLLDEPLNALDSQGHAVLAQALAAHLKQGGVVLMVSHVDPQQVLQHLPGVAVHNHMLVQGELRSSNLAGTTLVNDKPDPPPKFQVPVGALLKREWCVLWGNPQAVLWSAVFHWLVLSFFGIGLGKPGTEVALVVVWVSLLLAMLLSAKDWFTEDYRVGWTGFIAQLHPHSTATYWLVRVLYTAMAQILVLVPVTGLVALQFGLSAPQSFELIVALAAGVWALAPLLGIVALLVMLTRGGAVLVYLIALPLLVPVMIFGLEASRAVELGRSALAPLAVLFCMGLLACLLGPKLAQRLIHLIQE